MVFVDYFDDSFGFTLVCMGDFNEILLMTEKRCGNDSAEWQMTNFRNAVDVCSFHDVAYSKYEFTYYSGRELKDNIQCRLDRALPTSAWLSTFSDSHLWHLD